MAQNATTSMDRRYSLLPEDDEHSNQSAPRGFLARLEEQGARPEVQQVSRPTVARRPGLLILALVFALVLGGGLYLYPLGESPHPPRVTHHKTPPPPAIVKTAVPAPDENIANNGRNVLPFWAEFGEFTALNPDFDAMMANDPTRDGLSAFAGIHWQSRGFARVDAVDPDALDRVARSSRPQTTHRRSSTVSDSDVELLEVLMKRLRKGQSH